MFTHRPTRLNLIGQIASFLSVIKFWACSECHDWQKTRNFCPVELSWAFRPMSHLQFSRTILSSEFSRATKLQVWHGESRDSMSELYAVQLCWQNAERWLVSCHRCCCFASVRCTYASFCLIYFNLFNLFNLEMERSDGRDDAAANWIIRKEASMQLDNRSVCNFIAPLYCTFSRQNCARKLQVWHQS